MLPPRKMPPAADPNPVIWARNGYRTSETDDMMLTAPMVQATSLLGESSRMTTHATAAAAEAPQMATEAAATSDNSLLIPSTGPRNQPAVRTSATSIASATTSETSSMCRVASEI